MKAMYHGKEVEVIDCTPTWEAILRTMLDSYTYLRSLDYPNAEQRKALYGLETEFQRMAKLADKQNQK